MNKTVLLIAARLLREASSVFSDHGCDDFELEKTQENIDFALSTMDDSEYKAEFLACLDDDDTIIIDDWKAMDKCAEELKKYAETLE